MENAIEIIDRRIAAHQGAIETLRALRVELAGCSEQVRPSAPSMPLIAVAPVPALVAAVERRRPGRPAAARPAAVRPAIRPGDPPPPPGLSIRDQILEQLQKGPMSGAEIIAATGLIPASVYDVLGKMRKSGVVEQRADTKQNYLVTVRATAGVEI